MAKICTISDDSDTSGDQEDTETEYIKAEQGVKASRSEHHLSVLRATSRGEQQGLTRHRNFSINEDDFQEATDGKSSAGDGDSFRPRSRSAPPAFWAAKKYGRELRKMSDEFDTLLDKGLKRVRSAGTTRQMHTSPSWFNFLWSHKESDTETMSSLSAQNTRPAE
ncbi:BCL2-antagonist of cell death b isoform 2 [Silurus meridionalis]|nr:BCL2-antagonist of cell death b isoform 2 [Silurus meridionalis]